MLQVSQRVLYILAMVMWLFAGTKVLYLGYKLTPLASPTWYYGWLVVSFVFFTGLIFRRVVPRYVTYIEGLGAGAHPFYHCFAPRAWGIIAVMMTLGLVVRYGGIAGPNFIAGFYTGLGVSLLLATRFYIRPIIAHFRQS